MHRMPTARDRGLVPHRQPGASTARRRCDQVAAQSQADRRGARRRHGRSPVRGRVEAGAHRRRRHPRGSCWTPTATTTASASSPGCTRSRPAKMWIAGLDALRKPLLHLHTQANVALPWAEHRHGLHEPQPGRARRPRVRLHPDPARRAPARRSPATSADPTVAGRVGAWVAGRRAAARDAAHAAAGPVRRQHARRRGHRGRQGRGASCASASRSTPTASTTWSRSSTRSTDADVDALVAEYDDAYDVAPELLPGGDAARVAARTAPRIELGPAPVPRRRRVRRLHHQLRGPRRPAAAARASPCSG